MNNFRLRFAEFMRGRNGTDELYILMMGIYTVMIIANLFVRSRVFSIIIWLWLLLAFYRFFSKNIAARQRENYYLLRIIEKFRSRGQKKDYYEVKAKKQSKFSKKAEKYKTMYSQRKNHVFKNCPNCKATIRLPKVSGEHTVCCPKCNTDFKVKIR
ncbi:MAG: hypothetical protein IJU45_07765 [Clostridia bacterium]|nr:hypothetical protein [Clostridia bacterium]